MKCCVVTIRLRNEASSADQSTVQGTARAVMSRHTEDDPVVTH